MPIHPHRPFTGLDMMDAQNQSRRGSAELPEADDITHRMGADDIHLYTADTVRRLLADERRKALEEIEADCRQNMHQIVLLSEHERLASAARGALLSQCQRIRALIEGPK
jgi:hypothetical protein